MPERVPHSLGGTEHVSRLLVEKRCDVYSQVAALVMEVEEALDEDDGLRTRYLLRDIRRCLRRALAFLTDEVYEELSRLETIASCLPAGEGPIPPEHQGELQDRLQLLHVKLARSLKLPYLQDLEQIMSLPTRLKLRLREEEREREGRRRQLEIEERCWDHESEARALLKQKHYPKAIKSLRKAVRLDPTRAVFHNDLGVVFSLQDKNSEAVQEYREAVSLNERYPGRRTDEWTTSYYNLGIALRKVAHQSLARNQSDGSIKHLCESREAFREYTRLSATGPKVQDARKVIEQISAQIQKIEAGAEQG